MTEHGLDVILARQEFCRGMGPDALALLAGCAENARYTDGEYLFRADTPAEHSFLVRGGRVSLQLHGPGKGVVPLETAEEGELIGWAWLFPPYRWHYDAVAVGPVRALRFDGACLRRKCESDAAFGYDLLKRILLQAEERLERSRMQALDLYGGAHR